MLPLLLLYAQQPQRITQAHKMFRSRNHYNKNATWSSDARELGWITGSEDVQGNMERAVRQYQTLLHIGHNKEKLWVAFRRHLDSFFRDIQANVAAMLLRGERAL